LQRLGDLIGIIRFREDLQATLVIGMTHLGQADAARAAVEKANPEPLLKRLNVPVTMLGDMLSVRAAAEKPPLSTTFTKVAMLVIRSMQSPDHAAGRAESSRRLALSSCQRSRLLTSAADANVIASASPTARPDRV
jgi:hypothetical protein